MRIYLYITTHANCGIVSAAARCANRSTHHFTNGDWCHGIGAVMPCKFIYTSSCCANLSTHADCGHAISRVTPCKFINTSQPMLMVTMVSAALHRATLSTNPLTHTVSGYSIGSVTPCKFIYTSLNPCK